ncbi:MAG: autotransporter-associated beta strand repeat-containing protein, partial [Thermoguttaceae bacterium]|nr:autotransporter-associated beta strand repeat-containing protein [Thermoguttaceae bacterium]
MSLAQDEQSEDTPTVYYLINDQSPLYYPYDWTTAEEWSGDVAPGSTNGAIFAVGSGYWLRVPFVYHSETKTYDPQTFPSLDGGAINSLYLGYSLQNGELVPDSGFLNVKIPSTTIDNLVIGNGTVYQGNALFENGKVLPQVLYGNITVNGNASFTVNNEAETDKRSMTIESLISGAGTLNFTTNVATTNPPATGFTIAHDSNPFTGPVTIDGNTRMAFSGENCLASASSITSAGDLILYANQTFKDFSGSGSLAIVNSDILTLNTTTDLTYAGLISGAGSLVKNGSGTFTLDGEYTYEGNTTVNDGSLVLTKKGDVRNLTGSGNLVNNSTYTITLQYDNDATFGGLSGNGSFTKAGPGDLTLTKAPDYQGKTTIMQGNLNLLAGGTLNNLTYNVTKNDIPAGDDLTTYIENNGNITIADNQTLTVNVTSDCNYLGVINPDLENSTAKLVKNGSGKWTLKSTLNKSVNCAIEINDGTVRLNNPLTTGYDRFGGDVTINKNGTLECLNKDSFGTGSTPLKIIINGGKLKLDSNNQTFTEKEFIFTGGSIIGESYEGIHLKAGTSITANAAEGATAEKPTVATITVPIKVRNIEGNDNPPKLNITVNKN